jgi:hypothetical protein
MALDDLRQPENEPRPSTAPATAGAADPFATPSVELPLDATAGPTSAASAGSPAAAELFGPRSSSHPGDGRGRHDPPENRPTSVETRTAQAQARSGAATAGSLLLSALLALVFGAIGASAYMRFLGTPPGLEASAAANPNPNANPNAPADSNARPDSIAVAGGGAEGAAKAEDVRALKSRVDDLATRADALRNRIEEIPKPQPVPNLNELQKKVVELTRASDEVAPLPGQVKQISEQIAETDQKVTKLQDQVLALETKTATADIMPGLERRDTTNLTPAAARTDQAVSRGAALFRQGKYRDALTAFSKLEQSDPDDARVWYYAALSNGLATRQWESGETVRRVEKGVERERAGTPPNFQIDAAFRDLTPATGRDWLEAYRRRARTR